MRNQDAEEKASLPPPPPDGEREHSEKEIVTIILEVPTEVANWIEEQGNDAAIVALADYVAKHKADGGT
ncbi:MAG: hypothetical protein KAT70_00520 [Thermoplasmata archaeon]|nr:hypothetical protein [Thermoplasmata archaeon]